ncbi:MAG: hypothetical protein ACYS76_03685 [Planctomycetota bacterium]|jgi:hypothetical protein
MKPTNKIERLVEKSRYKASPDTYDKTLHSFMQAVDNYKKQKSTSTDSHISRTIMKITKYAAAAVIIIAVLIGVNQFGGPINAANAAFVGVIEDVSNEPWLHLTLDVQRNDDNYSSECWLSIKRGIFASRFDSGIIWRNYFDHQERIYVPATNKLYIRYFRKGLSEEDQPVLNYLKMLFSPEITTDATVIKRLKDFEGEQVNEFELMKKEDGGTAYFRLLTDPDTNILKNIEAGFENANAEKILYLEGQGNYLYKGPSNIYDLGVPTNAETLNRLPTLEAKELMDTCRIYRENFSSYIIVVIMGSPGEFGSGIEVNYVKGDTSKAGRNFKYLQYYYVGLNGINREQLEKEFKKDFDSTLNSIQSERKYQLSGAGLWDGRNHYLIRQGQTPILKKARGIGGFRDIAGYGWPIVLPTGKIIEDEYSKAHDLICLRAFGDQLYFDPEHDYICVRRIYGRNRTDGHISFKAEEEIPENRYKQLIRQVTELGQTGNGLWYPSRVEGILIHSNDQGEEISRTVTYTDTIYIKMVSDFPTGTFDPDNLPRIIE